MISPFCVIITEIVRSNAKNRIALKAVRTKLITRLLLMGNCQLSCQSFVNDGIMSLVKVPVQHESACQSFIALSDLCWLNPNAKLFTLTMDDIFSHFLPSTVPINDRASSCHHLQPRLVFLKNTFILHVFHQLACQG